MFGEADERTSRSSIGGTADNTANGDTIKARKLAVSVAG
jgi:hypothetical protein